MFLSANEISFARERVLNNMLVLSAACIESGRQLSFAVASAGRASIEHGGRRLSELDSLQPETAAQFPASFWLDNLAQAGRLLDDSLLIVGEVQKALIRSAETQVRIIDAMAIAAIARTRRTSPREAEAALDAMRESLESAEQTFHELSEAAIDTVGRVEGDILESAGELSPSKKPAARSRSARVKKAD